MIFLVVAALALMGSTTWLAMQQSIAGNPRLNHRLTTLGLALCLATGLSIVVAELVSAA
jgi:hypothetical protein